MESGGDTNLLSLHNEPGTLLITSLYPFRILIVFYFGLPPPLLKICAEGRIWLSGLLQHAWGSRKVGDFKISLLR